MIPRKAPRLSIAAPRTLLPTSYLHNGSFTLPQRCQRPQNYASLAASPQAPSTAPPTVRRSRGPPRVPQPTPFVPDVPTFLTLIGRNMSAHSSKFPTWDTLFRMSSDSMREAGLEPARARRYILRWREKFRCGEYGIGGDLSSVQDGAGQLRIVSVPEPNAKRVDLLRSAGERRVVLNMASDEGEEALLKKVRAGWEQLKPVAGVKIKDWNVIAGKNVKLLKSGRAEIRVAEGLWEHKRGVKVDGGERRKAEVRAKRRIAENKK